MKRATSILIVFMLSCFSMMAQIKVDSLFLYYPFSGNANDHSADSLHGQVVGASLAADRFGVDSNAYSFDGINDYIVVPDTSLIKTPSFPFSVSVWVKIINYNNKVISLYKSNNSLSHYSGYSVNYTSTGTVTAGYGNGGLVSVSNRRSKQTNQTLSLNVWHHILTSFNGPNDFDIYIDGNTTTGSYSGGASSLGYVSAPGVIGVNNAPSGSYHHNGLIDDIRVWRDTTNLSDAKFLFFESPCASNINLYDTIVHFDSVTIFDTIVVFDTISITKNIDVVDTLLINLPIGLSELEREQILIYPNPTSSTINLDLGELYRNKKVSLIAISDALGREVYHAPISQENHEIQLADIGSPGLYLLQLVNDYGQIVYSKRIVLQ